MYCLKNVDRNISNVIRTCKRCIITSRQLLRTHYEVLNINNDSSQKEIRDAYIKLCKQHHPDKTSQDTHNDKEFLLINEAYNVLSKPSCRDAYDKTIGIYRRKTSYSPFGIEETDAYRRAMRDRSFYRNRVNEINRNPVADDEYYGIKGIKRVRNSTIFMLLVTISFIAGFIQIYSIKYFYLVGKRHSDKIKEGPLKDPEDLTEDISKDERLQRMEANMISNEKYYRRIHH